MGAVLFKIKPGMLRSQLSPWRGECGPTPSAEGFQHKGCRYFAGGKGKAMTVLDS